MNKEVWTVLCGEKMAPLKKSERHKIMGRMNERDLNGLWLAMKREIHGGQVKFTRKIQSILSSIFEMYIRETDGYRNLMVVPAINDNPSSYLLGHDFLFTWFDPSSAHTRTGWGLIKSVMKGLMCR